MTRSVPAALLARLESGIMANADAFVITLRDGTSLGFASCDVPVMIGGVLCQPGSGFAASTYDGTLGATTDGSDVEGILDSERITESDIHRGRWDDARVDQYLCDWQTGESVLLHVQTVAEIERQGRRFSVQLRSAAAALEDERGIILGAGCRHALGDAQCGVDLAPFTVSGAVTVTGADWIEAIAFAAQPDGWYDDGTVVFAGGTLAQVQRHEGGRVTFWRSLPVVVATGAAFTATAGCDKTWATCRATFANGDEFGGCPHHPGKDAMFQQGADGTVPSNVPVVLSDPPAAPVITSATGDGDGSAMVMFGVLYGQVESRADGTASPVDGRSGKIRIEGLTLGETAIITLVAVTGELESGSTTISITMPEPWPQSGSDR